MITVLIADDEPHLARALQNHLKAWPDLEVVAVARNGLEAAERIALTGRADWGAPDARMGLGALRA